MPQPSIIPAEARDVIYNEDCLTGLARMPDESVQCCITSPPYFGLRDYGVDNQIGLEESPEAYLEKLVSVFREVRRVLRNDGTLWLNLGDSYSASSGAHKDWHKNPGLSKSSSRNGTHHSSMSADGLKPKDLIGIPWMVAFALRVDGWFLRQDIIWNKPNPMPESVRDRCTKSHEYIFLLTKSPRYFYNADAISEPVTDNEYRERGKIRPETSRYGAVCPDGPQRTSAHLHSQPGGRSTRNKRSVWDITPQPTPFAHFATFPEELVETCLHAGSKPGDTVLDPFMGSGTVARVAVRWQRYYLGCELNPAYLNLSDKRLANLQINLLCSAEVA